jgi:hypothetical protein
MITCKCGWTGEREQLTKVYGRTYCPFCFTYEHLVDDGRGGGRSRG